MSGDCPDACRRRALGVHHHHPHPHQPSNDQRRMDKKKLDCFFFCLFTKRRKRMDKRTKIQQHQRVTGAATAAVWPRGYCYSFFHTRKPGLAHWPLYRGFLLSRSPALSGSLVSLSLYCCCSFERIPLSVLLLKRSVRGLKTFEWPSPLCLSVSLLLVSLQPPPQPPTFLTTHCQSSLLVLCWNRPHTRSAKSGCLLQSNRPPYCTTGEMKCGGATCLTGRAERVE